MEPVRREHSVDGIVRRTLEIIAEIRTISVDEVGLECSLEELGFDSLDGMILASDLEEEFGIEIPEEVLRETRSVPQIIKMVQELACISHRVSS